MDYVSEPKALVDTRQAHHGDPVPAYLKGCRVGGILFFSRSAYCGRLIKSLQAGLCTTQDQGVYIMRAFVGVHDFQVHQVPRDAEFI